MSKYKEAKKNLKEKADNKKTRTKKSRTKKVKTKGKTESKKVAKKLLKENMRQEYQISLSVDGCTKYIAGMIIELDSSFGKFEGKYIIDKVTHNVSGDYSCDIEASKLGARENAEQKAKAQAKEEQKKKELAKKNKKKK